MKASKLCRTRPRGVVQSAMVSALCATMIVPPAAFAAAPAGSKPKGHPAPAAPPLSEQQRVLQALNRLTFGPRPGDEAAVEKIGLDAWFEEQLHPERIDDSALDRRLAVFPAMRLSQAQLLERFPDPQMLRMMGRQNLPLPPDPIERAIWADGEALYQARRKKQEEAQAPAPTPATATAGMTDAGMPAVPVNQPGAAKVLDNDLSMAAGMAAMADTGQPVTKAAPGGVAAKAPAKQPVATNLAPQNNQAAAANVDVARKKRQLEGVMDDSDVQALLQLTPDVRFMRLVQMTPAEMVAFDGTVRPPERQQLAQGMSPQQVETVQAILQGAPRVVGAEALASRLERDVYSERQLQAVMTDFWLNHFSVYVRKDGNEPFLLPSYQREAILPNALGSFEKLLVATAQSPAMLVYLDNWLSIGPDSQAAGRVQRVQQLRPNGALAKALPKGINENYARELMELHTLGVNGGYTQQDVIEVAKCFTGWTIDRRNGTSEFVFEPNRHEPGPKTVLGHKIPEGGEKEGLEVLHILATSPATARFVSNKLAVRFVSDNPPKEIVDRMAATFLSSNGDIGAVLSTMFHSPEFFSPAVYRAKVKTPIEFVVSALRASDANVVNPVPVVQAMERLGMPIYGMQTPNGYSWTADDWVNSNALIARMNFALVLAGNRLPGTKTNWPALLGSEAENAASPTPETEAKLETVLLGQAAAQQTRATVLDEFNNPAAQQQAEENFKGKPAKPGADGGEMSAAPVAMRLRPGRQGGGPQAGAPGTPLATMAGLLLGSPDFQRR